VAHVFASIVSIRLLSGTRFAFYFFRDVKKKSGSESKRAITTQPPNPKVKELAVRKLLVAGVAGLMLMAAAGTQTAMAAPWHGGYRGHYVGRTAYRTVYNRPHFYRGPVVRNYCW
jgi:hypothetical protein